MSSGIISEVPSASGMACLVAAPLARRGGLLRGSGRGGGGSGGGGLPPIFPAFGRGGGACVPAAPGPAALFAAGVILVDGRPGAALGFFLADSALFIAF